MAARLKERVSAPKTVILRMTPGVNSRASKPKASRIGKKISPTDAAMPFQFLERNRPVAGSDAPFFRNQLTTRTTLRTTSHAHLPGRQLIHVDFLCHPTDHLPHFMSRFFDENVMRHSLTGHLPLGQIQLDFQLSRPPGSFLKFCLQLFETIIHDHTPK